MTIDMFKGLFVLALAFSISCTAPTTKSASVETLRDTRNFNNVNVYGGSEFPVGKVFGQIEIKSNPKTSTDDFTNFNSRIRFVRPLYNGFGVTSEYRDFSGDKNNVSGTGLSYSLNGLEFRFYPLRTDEAQEAGISFGKVFEMGELDPYVRGFADINKKESGFYSVAKFQIGLKADCGWRIGTEIRYSDFDRRNGIECVGGAFGIGIDF